MLLLLLVSAGSALAEPIAERTLPATVAPGEEFTVEMNLGDFGPLGRAVETLPAGFDYVVGSQTGVMAATEDGNEVTFTLFGTTSFTYNVIAAAEAGTYEFAGTMADSTTGNTTISDVSGDTEIAVGEGTTDPIVSSPPKTETSSSGGSSSSGSSAGGSGASGEAFENIGFKDAKTENIVGGAVISYTFDEEENAIDYIKFTALKNYGAVSTTIEVLKNRSAMVDESAPGLVYSNLNIWVGKVGFATEDNIAHPVIGFSVPKAWLTKNEINEDAIALYRHSEGKWNNLNTIKIGEDDSYIYFEAETPGFSPFAISANTEEDDTSIVNDTEPKYAGSDTEAETPIEDETASEPNNTPGISGILSVMLLGCAYVFSKRKN